MLAPKNLSLSMEANALQQILISKVNTSERLNALKNFTTRHEQSQVFIPEYGLDLKRAVIQKLIDELQQIEHARVEELSLTLKTLRLLVREPEGTQSLFQRAALLRIMELAALSDHSPSSIPPSLTTTTTTTTTTTETNTNTNKLLDVEEEALKCLVNITLRSEAARQEFIVLNGPKYLVTRLPQYMSTITTPDARLLFALIRLIVVLTTPNKENINPITTTLLNLKILPLLVELLHRTVTDSTLFPSHCPPHLHEILKALFNLTFDMGPLGSGTLHYESFLPNFQLAIDALLRILHQPNKDGVDNSLHELKLSVINCLINIPAKFIKVILNEPYKTIDALLEVLTIQFDTLDEESDAASALVTILMLLTAIAGPHGILSAAQIKSTPPHLQPREYLLKRLFPNRDLDQEEIDEEQLSIETKYKDTKTLGNQIIKHMTAVNIGLKYYANELLFQICDEDAERFVRLTGFGNAAGLLAMRNLFGMGAYLHQHESVQSSASSDSSSHQQSTHQSQTQNSSSNQKQSEDSKPKE